MKRAEVRVVKVPGALAEGAVGAACVAGERRVTVWFSERTDVRRFAWEGGGALAEGAWARPAWPGNAVCGVGFSERSERPEVCAV